MSETIDLTSIANPELHTEIVITGSEALGGGNETKQLLQGEVAGRAISLVKRPFDENYIDTWTAFRAAGMPVVPTLRRNAENSLLVTDVKADGSEVYGKALNLIVTQQVDEQRTRARPEIDKIFTDLTHPRSFPDIQNEAWRLLHRANDNALRLPYDDVFELVVHPDGTWDLITLDLRYADVYDPDRSNPKHLEEAKKYNCDNVVSFLRHLSSLHEHLVKQTSSRPKLPFGRILGWR